MNKAVYKIGFWSGLIAFLSAIAYCIVQLLQVYNVLSYPTDEILIYSTSLCIVIPFIIEMLALHYITPDDKKFWSHGSLIFTIIYAVFVTANYVVQLATVIPFTLKGNLNEIRILQQTPHSMFWNFDAIGYICMGLATLFAVPVFKKEGFEKWVRIVFIGNALVTPIIGYVYFYPEFSVQLLILGSIWGITAPASMLLLAIMFIKKSKEI
jgi:heme/copper-type cytochrome/quinol oxidase subunit 4